MIQEIEAMESREASLKEQNAAMKKNLAAVKAERESLDSRSMILAKKKALQDEEVAQTTRTEAQIKLDRTFRDRFPTLPKWEIAIDYFGCATVANPGWIYIGTEFCGWEPAINPFKQRIIIPISHITMLNKTHQVQVLEPMLFDVYANATIGEDEHTSRGEKLSPIVPVPLQSRYTFRSAKWRELFDTIQRQANRFGHVITLAINGKKYQ